MKTLRATLSLLALSVFLFSASQAAALDNTAKEVKTVKLTVKGMCCPSCLSDIENSLTSVAGVKSAKASFEPPETTVTFDSKKTTVSDLILAIGTYSYAGAEPKRAFKSEAERTLDTLQYFRGVADSLKPMVAAEPRPVVGPLKPVPE